MNLSPLFVSCALKPNDQARQSAMPAFAPDTNLLPKGISDFSLLRKYGQVYVDKTDQIVDLALKKYPIFLSRPRRFGKSLLVSAFAELFANGKQAFEGLKGHDLWTDEERYRVIRLDFSIISEFKSGDEFKNLAGQLLASAFAQAGLAFESSGGADLAIAFGKALMPCQAGSIVLLIDEYDSPLTHHLNEASLFAEVRSILRSFYAAIKSNSSKFRFVFITGIMKFQNANIFSAFNGLTDISLSSAHATLLGYTEAELHQFFEPYLQAAAKKLEMPEADLMAGLRRNYDGFCFDPSGSAHVFAPWSVLNFLEAPDRRFPTFWFSSAGQPLYLMNFLKSRGALSIQQFDKPYIANASDLLNSDDVSTLQPAQLLIHTGYLTIKKVWGERIEFGYPNEEVRRSMADLFYKAIFRSEAKINSLSQDFVAAVFKRDWAKLLHCLNEVVKQLAGGRKTLANEAAVQQLVQVFSLGASLGVRAEVASIKGRSDLELEIPAALSDSPRSEPCGIVFEFKFAREKDRPQKLLELAAEQIRSRDYGLAGSRRLDRLALVYSQVQARFVGLLNADDSRERILIEGLKPAA